MSSKRILGATLAGRVVLAFAWVMLALSGSALANPPDGNGNHDHGGGGGTIPVTVTFEDLLGDGLTSDCGTGDCAYIDNVDKVNAGISTRGNFRMSLTKGNQPAIRTLFLDFSDCMEGPCEPPFLQGPTVGPANVFTSGSGINLKEMHVGEVRHDLSLGVSFDLTSVGSGAWRLFFDPSNANCPESSTITVTRIDTDAWEIEAGENDVACLAKQAGGGVLEFSGLYRIPFKITVQKK